MHEHQPNPQTTDESSRAIPMARPASRPVVDGLDGAPVGPWWAPRPMSRGEAAGDVLILIAVLLAPKLAEVVVMGTAVLEAPPAFTSPQRLMAANALTWAAYAALAVWLVRKSRQPLSSMGIRRATVGETLGAGALATACMFLSAMVLGVTVWKAAGVGHEHVTTPMRNMREVLGPPSWFLVLTIPTVAAIFEELVFRGFVLTRLRVLLRSWPAAVLAGSVVFALPHIWQGWWGMMLVTPVALVLSITFVLTRNLWAPMIAHWLFNFLQMSLAMAIDRLGLMDEILNATTQPG